MNGNLPMHNYSKRRGRQVYHQPMSQALGDALASFLAFALFALILALALVGG